MSGDVHVRIWERVGVRLPRATRLVICCKGPAEEARASMQKMMERLKLTVNEEKTRLCRVPAEQFDFLGYTFGRCYSTKTGRTYLGTRPSRKSVQRLTAAISAATTRQTTWVEAETRVGRLNDRLRGWANYFCLGPVSKAYRAIEAHTTQRLRRWLCNKHKVRRAGYTRYPTPYLHQTLGLVDPPTLTQSLPWANA
jgi:RNA-directed DNA polymerase